LELCFCSFYYVVSAAKSANEANLNLAKRKAQQVYQKTELLIVVEAYKLVNKSGQQVGRNFKDCVTVRSPSVAELKSLFKNKKKEPHDG
jgi:hypothetical protein